MTNSKKVIKTREKAGDGPVVAGEAQGLDEALVHEQFQQVVLDLLAAELLLHGRVDGKVGGRGKTAVRFQFNLLQRLVQAGANGSNVRRHVQHLRS